MKLFFLRSRRGCGKNDAAFFVWTEGMSSGSTAPGFCGIACRLS